MVWNLKGLCWPKWYWPHQVSGVQGEAPLKRKSMSLDTNTWVLDSPTDGSLRGGTSYSL